MQQEQFDHSPPQTTLTQHKWMDTRKVGRDDDEIRRNRLYVEAERKRKRKKDKPFAHGTGGVIAAENTEISELTQPEVLEATRYMNPVRTVHFLGGGISLEYLFQPNCITLVNMDT